MKRSFGSFCAYTSIALLQCAFVINVSSQPTMITPLDVARAHQYSSITDDHSYSALYNFEQPLELYAHILYLHTPEDGYATIGYTLAQKNEDSAALRGSRAENYIATLNASSVVTHKSFGKMNIPRGAVAVLYGWPATDTNVTNANLLVDELHLVDTGEWFSFHRPSERMPKHRKAKGPRLEAR